MHVYNTMSQCACIQYYVIVCVYIDIVCVLSIVLLQVNGGGEEGLSVDSGVWNSFLESALRWVARCVGGIY